jgi:uncharacterized protein YoxC
MSEDMRREVNSLKTTVEATNTAVASLADTVKQTNAMLHRTMVSVAQLVGKIDDMSDNMATKKDISQLNERMDGFAGLLLDSRHRWAVHAGTLAEHDQRLKKLEPPTA